MKFIWLSVAGWAPTGYGLVTRQIVPRIQREGHEVTVATKHFHTGLVTWEGIPTIPGMDMGILNRMVDKGEVDYIISLLDNHALPDIPKKWISYTPFDTQKIPESISKTLVHPELIIALTRHGQKEIEGLGYKCWYAPHGVDLDVFYPDAQKRQEGRENLEWQDNFIIGSVGVNYHDDRKNFVNLVLAFKWFHEKHEEARLFLSTNPVDVEGDKYLPLVIQRLGLNQLVKWPHPDKYYTGQVGEKTMANRYRQLDLFCMPTKGEGFGLPLLEAQACGVPVVTTGASTGPELCPTQYLIPVKDDEWQWFNKEWRPNVSAQSILEVMEKAYNDPGRESVGLNGQSYVTLYDWDTVFEKYWKPILKEIEGLKTRVKNYPDYRKLYETFSGRITMSDCGAWCKEKCAPKYPLLPGEPASDRSILSRSYPVFPDKDGKLFVIKGCSLHNWISKKFKSEVKEAWEYLWGFPVIRKFFKDSVQTDDFIPIDELEIDFNDEYKWAMQSQYYTNWPDLSKYLKGKVLEVGCGDGARVRDLRENGVDAVGIEINPAQVDDVVQKGDAEALEFADNSFDVVYSVDVLEHLSKPLSAISEAFRVSKGLVIAAVTPIDDKTFWEDPTHKVEWDRERWKRELNEFGEIIDILEPFTLILKRRE